MANAAVIGKRARAKGKLFQKQVVKLISDTLGLSQEDLHSCVGGKTEADIQLSTAARKKFPFHVECKNQKTLHLGKWIKQSESESSPQESLVVFKFHRNSTPYVVLRFEEFLKIWLKKNTE